LKIPPRLVIDKRKIAALPKNEQCLIIAGSQGQLGSSLEKIATGEHKVVHLDPGDKVIFSSDPIPGNEANVYRLVDMLSAHQLEVIYYDIADDLHVSGHASSSELMMLIAMTKPKYVLPTGGTYRHMIQYGKLAAKMGLASDHILMPENQVIVLEPTGIVHYGEKLDIKSVYVESGQIFRSDAPLTDRKLMYQEGVVIAAITIRQHTLDLDLIPKGLTPPVGNDILSDIKGQLLTILRPDDITRDKLYSKDRIAKEVSRLFVAKIGKNPLVIPIIIES